MPISRIAVRARTARICGLHTNAGALADADDIITDTLRKWNTLTSWEWLLKDTSNGFTLLGLTGALNAQTITVVQPGTADGVNLNVTLTANGATYTVDSYARNAAGQVATIHITTPLAAALEADDSVVVSGDIPLVASVAEYNLPPDFSATYNARTLGAGRLLQFIRYRQWNLMVASPDSVGLPECYTTYNPVSSGTQGAKRLRVFRTPAASEVLRLQYFRNINFTSDVLDIPEEFIGVFIKDCQTTFLMLKDTEDPRLPAMVRSVETALTRIMSNDREGADDEEPRLISNAEATGAHYLEYD